MYLHMMYIIDVYLFVCFQLFDHIVSCIAEFLEDLGLQHDQFTLGFTFSFPCIQDSLSSARLVRWTKGFKCSGVENQDVVALLHDAIRRRQVPDRPTHRFIYPT